MDGSRDDAIDVARNRVAKPKFKSRFCFVSKCDSGYRSAKEKVSLFSVPQNDELFIKWENAIPRLGLRKTSVLCEKHFTSSDVIRKWQALDQETGKIVTEVLLKKPRLKPDAIPTIFPGSANLSEKESAKRKTDASKSSSVTPSKGALKVLRLKDEKEQLEICESSEDDAVKPECIEWDSSMFAATSYSDTEEKETREKCDSSEAVVVKTECIEYDSSCVAATSCYESKEKEQMEKCDPGEAVVVKTEFIEPDSSCVATTSYNESEGHTFYIDVFSELWENPGLIQLPSMSWSMSFLESTRKEILIQENVITNEDSYRRPILQIILSSDKSVKVFILQRLFSNDILGIPYTIETLSDVSNLLVKVSALHVCIGGPPINYFENNTPIAAYKDENRWRHTACHILASAERHSCKPCSNLGSTLRQNSDRRFKKKSIIINSCTSPSKKQKSNVVRGARRR